MKTIPEWLSVGQRLRANYQLHQAADATLRNNLDIIRSNFTKVISDEEKLHKFVLLAAMSKDLVKAINS